MKFKKDGNVFEDIGQALNAAFRCNECCGWAECRLGMEMMRDRTCMEFAEQFPAEVARLMGYEVVEDESTVAINADKDESLEVNMDKQSTMSQVKPDGQSSKPLKDWTLGEVQEYCEERNGNCADDCILSNKGVGMVCKVALKPVGWDLSEKPRFTPEEVADARTIIRLLPDAWEYVSRKADGSLWILGDFTHECMLNDGLLTSIKTGETVKLSEIVGGDA